MKVGMRNLASGETLRKYRRRLGESASNLDKTVLTQKFALDFPQNAELKKIAGFYDFDNYRELYNTIEGCQKGSLSYFLFTLITAGFRIFPSNSKAETFNNRDLYDEDAFAKAWEKNFGASLPKLTIGNLRERLRKDFRSTGGKSVGFDKANIRVRYFKELVPSVPKGVDEAKLNLFFDKLAEEISKNFKSVKEIRQNWCAACQVVDTVLAKFGSFPSIAGTQSQLAHFLPTNSTIAFDSRVPFLSFVNNPAMAPYAVVVTVLGYSQTKDNKVNEFVKQHVTTDNGNGLSWLFNKGLKLFQTKTLDELAKMYGVPKYQEDRLKTVIDAAKAVKKQNFFSINYHGYRTSFAGRIDSWTTHYTKRLDELKTVVTDIPAFLPMPDLKHQKQNAYFWSEADVDHDHVSVLLDCFKDERPEVCRALDRLTAQGTSSLTINDIELSVKTVENFTDLVNQLMGIKHRVDKALEQAEKHSNSVWHAQADDFKKQMKSWEGLKKIPKLNTMSGGVVDAQAELIQLEKDCQRWMKACDQHFDRIKQWAISQGCTLNILEGKMKQLSSRSRYKRYTQPQIREEAFRRIAEKFARLVQRSNDPCSRAVKEFFKKERFFEDIHLFNKYFKNAQGRIYISPFAVKRNKPYALNPTHLQNPQGFLQRLTTLIEGSVLTWMNDPKSTDIARRLQHTLRSLQIASIDSMIPVTVADLYLTEEEKIKSLSSDVRFPLKGKEVSTSILSIAFNVYNSLIAGARTRLRREKFFLRTKFTWCANTRLFYVPKDCVWQLPERYKQSSAWAPILKAGYVAYTADGRVDTIKTFEAIKKAVDPKVLDWPRMLLRELPHTWYYEMPIPKAHLKSGPFVSCIMMEKGTLTVENVNQHGLARLKAHSVFMDRIDNCLVNNVNRIGDMTLLVDLPCEQKGTTIKTLPLKKQLAVPVTYSRQKSSKQGQPFKRIVAIDQGEFGLSFAVFECDDAGKADALPIYKGVIRIPGIRSLKKSVNKYRKSGKTQQNFNQRYNSTRFVKRKNAAGDVCGVIAGLMYLYQAFPILEDQVKNFASGSRELGLVYKMVNTRFIYDKIDAHKNERVSWWMGAKSWNIEDYGIRCQSDKDEKDSYFKKDGVDYKMLRVTPGYAVDARYTSCICSKCRRNALALLDEWKDLHGKNAKLQIDENGCVMLNGETIKLYKRPSKQASRAARRKNERADRTVPVDKQMVTPDELRRLIKDNLRRAPRSLMSRDTTQSQYYCVFKDCTEHNKPQHADINAAINIGRRFLGLIVKKP